MKFKKRFSQIGIFSILIMLSACGGSNQQKTNKQSEIPAGKGTVTNLNPNGNMTDIHQQHNSLAENFSHKDIVILEHPYQLAATTKTEMEQVIDAYLQLKDAFVKDDEPAAETAIVLMAQKVAAVVPTKLEGEGLEAWHNHQEVYEAKLKEMQQIKGLDNKRSYFSHISEIMYCTIKSFGLKQGNLFAIFCPMAFDGKGAYWISDSKTVQNPYLGSKMPTCGEVREEL
ncbi:MAG TPA: DUF3347 domain-containing protein [Prolixibacteraceae bacterium]|nr:DUF3347 domain-containing protein [Prolixibacteraceae bacterium]